jgi:hypothetical protein
MEITEVSGIEMTEKERKSQIKMLIVDIKTSNNNNKTTRQRVGEIKCNDATK